MYNLKLAQFFNFFCKTSNNCAFFCNAVWLFLATIFYVLASFVTTFDYKVFKIWKRWSEQFKFVFRQ